MVMMMMSMMMMMIIKYNQIKIILITLVHV